MRATDYWPGVVVNKARLIAVLVCCLVAASCSGATEVAEFDVRAIEEVATPTPSEPLPAAEADTAAQPDAPVASPDPTAVPEQASTPAQAATPEPTSVPAPAEETQTPDATADSDLAAPDDAVSDDQPDAATAEDEGEELALAVDTSRRGEVILVRDDSGAERERIEGELQAGQTLTYRFDVTAGQAVLVRQLGGCVFDGSNVLAADVGGPQGFGGAIFFNIRTDDCADTRRYVADETGEVVLEFRDSDPDFSGTFAFEVFDVTDEPIVDISFGDIVAPDSPIAGAGKIEFAGTQDVYRFEVEQGDAWIVQQLGCDLQGAARLSLDYEDAGRGFSTLRNGECDEADRFEASSSGTVLIVARDPDNEGTGTYSFELIKLNAIDEIALEFGDVVSADAPAEGAGRIEEVGAQDRYTIEVVGGETIALIQQGGCAFEGGGGVAARISGGGIETNTFFVDGDCFDVTRFTPLFDDIVTILVRESATQVTGTYNFTIGVAAETVDEAEDLLRGLDVSAGENDGEQRITLDETVLFEFGSAELKPAAVLALVDIAEVFGVYDTSQIRIVGHTDSVGSDAANQLLSESRANAVLDALVELGLEADRISASGTGETSPVAPNENDDGSDNPEGRAANRRVEIFFTAE